MQTALVDRTPNFTHINSIGRMEQTIKWNGRVPATPHGITEVTGGVIHVKKMLSKDVVD